MVSLGDLESEGFYIFCNDLYRNEKIAGGIRPDGYKTVSIGNKRYLVHRIMYMIYHHIEKYDDLPKIIDHINGDVSDNSKENLRGCSTNKENLYNTKPQKGTSRYKGVRFNGRSYTAQIMKDRKSIYLGSFKTEEEAASAYNAASLIYFGNYGRLNDINL